MADSAAEVREILRDVPDEDARALGRRARERVLGAHTAAHRAAELEALDRESPAPYRPSEAANILERTATL